MTKEFRFPTEPQEQLTLPSFEKHEKEIKSKTKNQNNFLGKQNFSLVVEKERIKNMVERYSKRFPDKKEKTYVRSRIRNPNYWTEEIEKDEHFFGTPPEKD